MSDIPPYGAPVTPFTPLQPSGPYESSRTRAKLAMIFFGITIVASLITIVSTYLEIDLISRVSKGHILTMDEATSNDDRQLMAVQFQLVMYVPTIVFFLMWLHRVYKNLKPLGTPNPNYTPGWAVGYFFIPFINLIRPYQVVQETWTESDPETVAPSNSAGQQYFAFQQEPAKSGLVTLWWITWLVANVTAFIAVRIKADARSIKDYAGADWVDIFSDVIGIIAATSAIVIIDKITAMQEERHRRITALSASMNPFTGQNQTGV